MLCAYYKNLEDIRENIDFQQNLGVSLMPLLYMILLD